MKRVVYCGSIPNIADEFIMNNELDVVAIVSEAGTVSNEMVYLSCLREIPIVEVRNKNHLEDEIFSIEKLDSIVICGFGIILTKELLAQIPAYNFHPGELPHYRGRHPTFFATISGEKNIGISLHEVTPEIDEGRVLGIEFLPYGYRETEIELSNKLYLAVRALLPLLSQALNGDSKGVIAKGGVYYNPVSELDKIFTATDPPSRICNIVRAQARYEGAIFKDNDQQFWVKELSVSDIDLAWTSSQNVLFQAGRPVGIRLDEAKALFFKSIRIKED